MHINRDVRPLEYPFVFAHEYSHVLGVSNEAEANFWAFESCRHSPVREFRYSAWFMLLTHTAGNIHSLLGDEAFEAWLGTLRPEIWPTWKIPARTGATCAGPGFPGSSTASTICSCAATGLPTGRKTTARSCAWS